MLIYFHYKKVWLKQEWFFYPITIDYLFVIKFVEVNSLAISSTKSPHAMKLNFLAGIQF
jgi:hypothetical protein